MPKTEMNPAEQLPFFFNLCPKDKTVYVGIDPGATGAVGLLCDGTVPFVFDIPTVKVNRKGGTKTMFNNPAIVETFDCIRHRACTYGVRLVIEEAQVQIGGKGANAYTGFRVGVAYGMWGLYLASQGFSVTTAHPGKWKTKMGLRGKDKEAARLMALGLWPKADIMRKKDHNRAEALLLAEWLRREGV